MSYRHPSRASSSLDWPKFRLVYEGGEAFRDRYLEKFSTREDDADFKARKARTPVPAFAKAAINDIRNAIFQRLADVHRSGGSQNYQRCVEGEAGGVDGRSSTMSYFVGTKILTDLLVLGQAGVFVDMPPAHGETFAESLGKKPYLYSYAPEDIINWSEAGPDKPHEFKSILLRDTVATSDQTLWLPTTTTVRYRHLWLENGRVMLQFYDPNGLPINIDGNPDGPQMLELTSIPFVMLDIGDSLLKDVADHQIALLNLTSSDVNYAIKSNFPFFTQQRDERAIGGHLKAVNSDGSAMGGGQGAMDETISVGAVHGRYYSPNMERPGFIAPPSDPLLASLELQKKLEADVRKLVNLAVQTLASRASAESKQMDNQGLEAGLSYIGLVLEGAERKIAHYWAAYEDRQENRRKIATVKYPDRYSLKTDSDRIEEADSLSKLMFAVPGVTVKKEIAKGITRALLGGKISVETLRTIEREIDQADFTTSDPDVIIRAKEAGLVGEQTASMALGFSEDEYLTAREDHVERVKRLAEAQGVGSATGAAARGVPDLSSEPGKGGREEKALTRNTDLKDSTEEPVRGEGK